LFSPPHVLLLSPSASSFFFHCPRPPRALHSFPTRRSSDLGRVFRYLHLDMHNLKVGLGDKVARGQAIGYVANDFGTTQTTIHLRSEEHTSELQSLTNLVCRLLLEKKKTNNKVIPERESTTP